MSELEEARVLRNSRREEAREIIGTLSWLLTRYRQLEKEIRKGRQLVTVTEKPLIRALRSALHKAEESLEEYEESIVGVMALEGLEDWDEENEHAIESREISDKLDTLGNDVVGLTAHFKEDEDNEEIFNEVYNELAEKYEKAATEAQKATFDKVYNELAEKAAEAQATFEIAEKAAEAQATFEIAEKTAEVQATFGVAKKYEADGNRLEDVSAKAGGRRSRNRYKYKAGGIRPSNRSGSRFKADSRNRAGNMRFGNMDRYRAGSRNKASSMNKASSRNSTGNMRSGNMRSGNRRSGSRRSGSRNKAASMEVEVDHELLIEMDAGKRGKELRSSRNKAASMEGDYMDADGNAKATGKELDSGHFAERSARSLRSLRSRPRYEEGSMKQVE